VVDAYWRLAKLVIKDTMSASRLWLARRMAAQIVENEGRSRYHRLGLATHLNDRTRPDARAPVTRSR
jgi:hypothetical protein